MIRNLLVVLFIFQVSLSWGQKRYIVNESDSSFFHIKKLKKATVLIRLRTLENSYYYLQALGKKEAAERVLREQKKKNYEIVRAFEVMYKFTPYKFFYSNQTANIKNGFFDGVFLNEKLEEDESVKLSDTSNYYIVDVGDIYFPSFGSSMNGVAMLDKNFNILKKPFPYYVRKREGVFFLKRTYADVVRIFDSNLEDFYNYSMSK